MKSKSLGVILRALPFFLVMSIGIAAYVGITKLKRLPASQETERLSPAVITREVMACEKSLELEVQGEVVPFREVSIAAEIPGRIESKEASSLAGRFVPQHALLLQIDPSDYDLEIRRIQQSIKETEVSIEEMDIEQSNNEQLLSLTKLELELQSRNMNRVESLKTQRATSQAAVDTARQAQLKAQNALQLLENQTRLIATRRGRYLSEKERLLVQLEKALLDRKRTEIRAPISGIIMEDPVEAGDYVQKGALLVRLEDTSKVEINFDLKLDQLQWIWAGSQDSGQVSGNSYALPPLPIRVRVEVEGKDYVWDAVLSRYDGARLNPTTRTVPCVAVVNDPRGGRLEGHADSASLPGPPALLRGMFVAVSIRVPIAQTLLEVPVTALRPGNKLWLAIDQRLAVRDVRVAQVSQDRVLLFAESCEIAAGDRVIVSPLPLAADTMRIREVDATLIGEAGTNVRNATKAVSTEVAR